MGGTTYTWNRFLDKSELGKAFEDVEDPSQADEEAIDALLQELLKVTDVTIASPVETNWSPEYSRSLSGYVETAQGRIKLRNSVHSSSVTNLRLFQTTQIFLEDGGKPPKDLIAEYQAFYHKTPEVH